MSIKIEEIAIDGDGGEERRNADDEEEERELLDKEAKQRRAVLFTTLAFKMLYELKPQVKTEQSSNMH